MGWKPRFFAKTVELSQNRISEIIGNTDFGEIDKMLSEGRDTQIVKLARLGWTQEEIAKTGV